MRCAQLTAAVTTATAGLDRRLGRGGSSGSRPSLLVGTLTVDQTIRAQANWIASTQLSDGAIPEAPVPAGNTSAYVTPYVSDYAVMGLARAAAVTGDQAYLSDAWKMLDFYARHEQPSTGYVDDFNVPYPSGTGAEPTGHYNSTDSYAALFLLGAYETVEAGGGTIPRADSWVVGAATTALDALLSTQQASGLFFATPTYTAALAMDNAEDDGGLLAAARLFGIAGDSEAATRARTAAERLGTGIQKDMWNATQGSFDWAVPESGAPNVSNVATTKYPDAVAQAWMVGYGAVTPTEAFELVNELEGFQPELFSWSEGHQLFAVALWALEQVGHQRAAREDAASISADLVAASYHWPVTTGAVGELIVAETGGLGLSPPFHQQCEPTTNTSGSCAPGSRSAIPVGTVGGATLAGVLGVAGGTVLVFDRRRRRHPPKGCRTSR
ncbi:hypothetical protein ACFFRE_07035 [Aciditerrimonas ferrireducens]|jgi:hypothetical protein|uniref:Uncharacterized protein n=1 Tax=Aciditerrimonas ferrireducens TaxID=667306 RepID=A0ABV6C2I4_9ACTN